MGAIGDVWFAVRADLSNFANELQVGVGKAAADVGKSTSKAFTDNLKLAAGAVGVLGVAISAIGLKSAIDWESAFAGVRKTVDATDEELSALAATLRGMAPDLGMSANELAGLAEAAGALGIKTADIDDFVRVTAQLGVTTNVSASAAATALGKINAVIPLTADEMNRFASTLVDLGNKGASTETEILDMAQNMGGVAAAIGMGIPQMLSWAAAAANAGLEADVGASQFQKLGLGIQKFVTEGGPQLGEIARLTGMTKEAFAELWSTDSSEAMRRIIVGLAEMDGNTRQATLAALGFTEVRMTRYLLGLAANQDNLNESLENGVAAWDKNSAMSEEFAKRADTVEFQMAALRAELAEVAIIVGEALLPHFRNFVGLLREVVGGIGNWLGQNKDLVNTLTPLLSVLSGILALKWGTKFLTTLLAQFGLRGLTAAILPAAIGAGTAAGTAQGGAHATAATGQGFITRLVAGIMGTQAALVASSSVVGRAAGMAMGVAMKVGLLAGLVFIGFEIAKAIAGAVEPHRQTINEAIFGNAEENRRKGGKFAGTIVDSIGDGLAEGFDTLSTWAARALPAFLVDITDPALGQLVKDSIERALSAGADDATAHRFAMRVREVYRQGIADGLDPEAARALAVAAGERVIQDFLSGMEHTPVKHQAYAMGLTVAEWIALGYADGLPKPGEPGFIGPVQVLGPHGPFLEAGEERAAAAVAGIKDGIRRALPELAAAFPELARTLGSHAQEFWARAIEIGKGIPSEIGRGMAQASRAIVDAAENLRWILENGLTDKQRRNRAIGEKNIELFIEGMRSQAPGAKDAAAKLGLESIAALSTGTVGTKESKAIARYAAELYAQGWTEREVYAALRAQGVGEEALAKLDGVPGFSKTGREHGGEYVEGITDKEGAAGNAGEALGRSARDGVGSISLWKTGANVAGDFRDGLLSKLKSVKGAATDLATAVKRILALQSPAKEGPWHSWDPIAGMRRAGTDMGQGLAEHLRRQTGPVKAAVADLARAAAMGPLDGALSALAMATPAYSALSLPTSGVNSFAPSFSPTINVYAGSGDAQEIGSTVRREMEDFWEEQMRHGYNNRGLRWGPG